MKYYDLIKAARVKLQLGWTQGIHETITAVPPRYCVLGALSAVCRERPELTRSRKAAMRHIAAAIDDPAPVFVYAGAFSPEEAIIVRFNDSQATTKADVLKVMDQAGGGK